MTNPNDSLIAAITAIADPDGVVAKFGVLIGNIELAATTMEQLQTRGHEAKSGARLFHMDRIIKAYKEYEAAGGTIALMRSLP